MLERLADMLRVEDSRGGFEAKPDMLSITGMTLEQFAELMQGLGYKADRGEREKVRRWIRRGRGRPGPPDDTPVMDAARRDRDDAAMVPIAAPGPAETADVPEMPAEGEARSDGAHGGQEEIRSRRRPNRRPPARAESERASPKWKCSTPSHGRATRARPRATNVASSVAKSQTGKGPKGKPANGASPKTDRGPKPSRRPSREERQDRPRQPLCRGPHGPQGQGVSARFGRSAGQDPSGQMAMVRAVFQNARPVGQAGWGRACSGQFRKGDQACP